MKLWTRRIAITLAVLIPVSVVAYFALEARGEERLREAQATFEREIGPLSPAPPAEAGVPSSDNVIALLREGSEVAQELGFESEDVAVLEDVVDVRGPAAWSSRDLQRIEAALQRMEPLVDVYRRARMRSDAAYRPEDVSGDDFSMPALRGSRLLLAEAGLALTQGDEAAARDSLEALSRIAWALENGPGVMHQLVGIHAEERLLRGVQWIVEWPEVSSATLRSLLEELPRKDAAAAFRHSMSREAGIMVRAMQGEGQPPVADWYRWIPGAVDRDTADLLDGYREFALLAEHPFLEARDERAEALEGPRRSTPKVVLDLLLPNFYQVIGKLQAVTASRQLARHALELRIAALEGSGYPAALDHLEPDPLTGTAPRYVASEAGARLENVEARELWRQEWGKLNDRPAPPYVWSLPPARG